MFPPNPARRYAPHRDPGSSMPSSLESNESSPILGAGVGFEAASASRAQSVKTFFLGRYRVVDEIGIGGMASVHLARMDGPGGFQKWVAIKRIHAHLGEDESFVRMFLDEARIAARISHPNVATVFDIGQHNETYWIAMEYLHGEPLREMMRRAEELQAAMAPEIACRILADAAEGLHAAHELVGVDGSPLNLVHRDVTPHNLFVTYDGSTKVVDFGIAKFASRLSHTRTGTLKGKLAYMSPEQVVGSAIDRRSDIFALGVVLWELTTGQRLFRMESDLDTLARVQECDVPRPSSIVQGYPSDLEQIVLTALAKNPNERFQTARDFSRALQTLLMRRGLFVTCEEVASYIKQIFSERVRQREAHLRWASEVTSTIEGDAKSLSSAPVAAPSGVSASAAGFETSDVPSTARPQSPELLSLWRRNNSHGEGAPSIPAPVVRKVTRPAVESQHALFLDIPSSRGPSPMAAGTRFEPAERVQPVEHRAFNALADADASTFPPYNHDHLSNPHPEFSAGDADAPHPADADDRTIQASPPSIEYDSEQPSTAEAPVRPWLGSDIAHERRYPGAAPLYETKGIAPSAQTRQPSYAPAGLIHGSDSAYEDAAPSGQFANWNPPAATDNAQSQGLGNAAGASGPYVLGPIDFTFAPPPAEGLSGQAASMPHAHARASGVASGIHSDAQRFGLASANVQTASDRSDPRLRATLPRLALDPRGWSTTASRRWYRRIPPSLAIVSAVAVLLLLTGSAIALYSTSIVWRARAPEGAIPGIARSTTPGGPTIGPFNAARAAIKTITASEGSSLQGASNWMQNAIGEPSAITPAPPLSAGATSSGPNAAGRPTVHTTTNATPRRGSGQVSTIGALTVVCRPECIEIIDNGVSYGSGNLNKRPISAGRHVLQLTSPQGLRKTIAVDIFPDQTHEVHVAMDR